MGVLSSASAAQSDMIDDFEKAAEVLRRQKPARHPQLRAAVDLLSEKRFGAAAPLPHNFLRTHPRDMTALYLAGEAPAGLEHYEQTRQRSAPSTVLSLRRCL